MRILYLVSGNDNFAGGATVRDAAFVRGLLEAGHEVAAISLHGPASVEGETDYSPVFATLGNDALQRYFPRLSRLPKRFYSLMRRPRPVANMTSFAVLGKRFDRRGPLAVGLLAGSDLQQRNEFTHLMAHLKRLPGRVDVVILANIMLSGLAEALKGNLDCPIVCLSQGSDRVIEALDEPYRSDARKLARKNARLFRMVVTTSRHFAIRTTESLSLPPSRVKVVPPGVDALRMAHQEPRQRQPYTIGYLAPICKEKGLDILVDTLDGLVKEAGEKVDPQLWIAGRVEDDRYWQRILRRLEAPALKRRYKLWGDPDSEKRGEFMRGLSVYVVPAREPESRATHMLEAMASGVPVVGPAMGVLPEIFQKVNGGLLVASEAPSWMFAQALGLLATMPDTADEMGLAAAEGVRRYFSIQSMAANLTAIIEEAIQGEDELAKQLGEALDLPSRSPDSRKLETILK